MKVNIVTEAPYAGLSTTGIVTAYRELRDALEERGVDTVVNGTGDYDVMHVHSFGPLARYRMWRTDRPVVVTSHTVPEEFRHLYRGGRFAVPLVSRWLARVYGAADLVLSPSRFAKRRVRELGVDGPVRVQSNGIDPSGFAHDSGKAAAFRETHDIDPDATVVGSVGLLSARKGLDTFVDVARAMPDTTFVWAGTNVYGHLLKDYRAVQHLKRDAPDNVHLPGYVDDIQAAYSAMDIFLFPTVIETEGLVALEATAADIPLVTSTVSGLDWLEDGTHCRKADTVPGYVEAVRAIRDGDVDGDELVANASELVAERDLDHVADQVIQHYEDVISDA